MLNAPPLPPPPFVCPQCGTQLAPTLRACPRCGRLLYAERLTALAASARQAAAAGDRSAALAAWREALDLLPPDSRQHQAVTAEVDALSKAVDAGEPASAPPPPPPASGGATTVGALPARAAARQEAADGRKRGGLAAVAAAVGVFLLEFKTLLVLLLTKGKLLLLGLTKGGTLFSMLLSMGVYWTIWGWPFAVGLVLSIYVHEMGHVFALNRFGFKATAPMFIPGVGALIRLQQHPVNPYEDARIGLAGPIWGLAAALASLGIWLLTRQLHAPQPIFAAVARVGAWINLFNLLPVWTLDGGRGFRSMSRGQRWLAVAVIGTAWFVTHESLLALLGIVAAARALGGPQEEAAQAGDTTATIQYAGLVAVLSALSTLHVPGAMHP